MKKHILFICPQLYPETVGGAEIFNYHFLHSICRRIRGIVITYSDANDLLCRVIRIPRWKPRRLFNHLFTLIAIIRLRNKISMIHLSYMGSQWWIWMIYPLLRKTLGIPYVVTIHGGRLAPWKPYWPLKTFFKQATIITGVSKRSCDEYHHRTGKDIIFTPPLIPFGDSAISETSIRHKYGISEYSRILLYVGSLKEIKGVDTLLYAFGELKLDFIQKNSLILMIIGDGPEREMLLRIAREKNIMDYVILTGRLERDLIPALYNAADIYVITSEFENTPLSMLEAMYHKLPIIASDAPGIRDLVRHGESALLFETRNVSQLSKAIEKMVKDGDLSRRLARKAYEDYHRQFNYDRLIDVFEDVFSRVAA